MWRLPSSGDKRNYMATDRLQPMVVVAGETPGRIRERNQNPNSTDETAPDDVGLDMGELPQPNIHCTQEHSDAPLAVSPIPAYRVKALNESSRMPHHHSANHLSHVAPDSQPNNRINNPASVRVESHQWWKQGCEEHGQQDWVLNVPTP